jgi:omega-6 fatty acid desaturase (delta-12 desaturase)
LDAGRVTVPEVSDAKSTYICTGDETPETERALADPGRPGGGAPIRTGRELILATKKFASDVPLKSWWYLLSTTVLLGVAMAGTVLIPYMAGKILASILAGLLLVRLFVIYHDQQHNAILANSRLAEWFMWFVGMWALNPSSIWRSSHNHHHNHNSKLRGSHIGSFPIMTADAFQAASRMTRLKYLFIRHPLTIFFGYGFIFLFGMCVNPFVNNPRRHFDCLLALLLHVAVGVALVWIADWKTLVLMLIIPHFLAGALGSYLFYVQHNFTDVMLRDNAGWTYETAALESSSFLRLDPAMAWFTANIGYHHIHHINSKIPFYRLPEAMRALPELQSPKSTSLGPLEVFRCLRIKVWDVRRQRMIRLSEI